jgi:hypothetical protein
LQQFFVFLEYRILVLIQYKTGVSSAIQDFVLVALFSLFVLGV